MFDVKETKITLPEPARIFASYECDCCKEDRRCKLDPALGDKKVCIDCYTKYDRFHV